MKLFGWLTPWWAYGIAVALLVAGSFASGWQVRSWKCAADELDRVRDEQKAADKAQDRIHTEGEAYEQDREASRQAGEGRQIQIREIYRDRIVPADCEPPADALGVLDDATAGANARARGEPGATVPAAPEAP